MSLLDNIKKDIELITTNANEFGVTIIVTSPTSVVTTINGLHTKHHLGVDSDGNAVNSKNARLTFVEKQMLDQGQSIRNVNGEVDLNTYKFDVVDSTGIVKHYTTRAWYPDEVIGMIVVILEDFDPNA